MQRLISVLLIIVALIHLPPLAGVLGAERLLALYGTAVEDHNLVILMRHRAIVLGMLGIFWFYCAFQPRLHLIAIVTGLVSVGSFLWLAGAADAHTPAIHRVVLADRAALGCLLLAALVHYLRRSSNDRKI